MVPEEGVGGDAVGVWWCTSYGEERCKLTLEGNEC